MSTCPIAVAPITYHLSTLRHDAVLKRFDQFVQEQSAQMTALKAKYRVEENINSEFLGLEQWKVDFIKRQRAKKQASASAVNVY
jgi:hypothetical protein